MTMKGLSLVQSVRYVLLFSLLVTSLGLTIFIQTAEAAVVNVPNAVQFNDTSGNPLNAHGGGMIKVGSYYYWVGENRDGTNLVSLYRSTDLKNWEFRANLLYKAMGGELATANIERPKLLYNASTGKYVMWMHKENGVDYGEGRVAVASSSNIEGPYTYHGSFRPLDYDSRDMTVYNDGGTAYLISATSVNANMNIYQLTSDFLGVSSLVQTLWVGQYREAPAMFKRGSTYFLITSGATGWNPNQAKYATASSIAGTWTSPVNFGNANTYYSQSTYVIPVEGTSGTSYLYLGDRWAGAWSGPVNTSTYVWLPLSFPTSTTLSMSWFTSLNIDTATGTVTGVVPTGTYNRFESHNYAGRYMRHLDFTTVRVDSSITPVEDSQFRLVPGLADSSKVSFESVNFPGYYLRHYNYNLQLALFDGSPSFKSDATFEKVAGLADATKFSFRSYNYPTRYIRHYNYVLRIDPITTATEQADATFKQY